MYFFTCVTNIFFFFNWMTVDKIVLQIEVNGSLLSLFTDCIVVCGLFFFYSWGKVSVPLCYSFKGPSTAATTAMASSLSAAKVLCNTLLFISGFSPEEPPTIASEYLFKNSNLRLFYIHTVVIFMNKDGKYVSLSALLPAPFSRLNFSRTLNWDAEATAQLS